MKIQFPSEKDLKKLTFEELKREKKMMKNLFIGIAIPLGLGCLILLYLVFNKELYALIGCAILSLVALLPMWMNLEKINKEIKLRNKRK